MIDTKKDHEASGYQVECTHAGQKRAYGDNFREYTVVSDKPESEVRDYCTSTVYPCFLTREQWSAENNTASQYFRSSYVFRKIEGSKYFYQVMSPYAD